ncbi:MAG: tRNA (adenosine(37)-N6)-threonylcarbamoyltransferase complex transferase subunit TsaD [Candidatus Levybacteria bacterium]|nr:tRNA (adenosine(37)-N6)-threonylcarbamoyltransferase complex transferase subunit TsaD [Candidatus Levybacteria bacterium]
MRILGIETSCDETSAAVVEDGTIILSNVISSSLPLHAKTGGIIPEVAARQQIKYIIPVIEKSMENATALSLSRRGKLRMDDIDAIAVTVGPGLIGSLLVGVETAKTLAYVWNKPIIPVNHLIGHIYANFISTFNSSFDPELRTEGQLSTLNFPAIVLLVSGGHTDLLLMEDHGKIKWLGGTRDDAAGEAFDKIARLLGLPYPGGPSIEREALNGNPKAFNFPRPMLGSGNFDFSFSGLKTAVYRTIQSLNPNDQRLMTKDLAASVQQSIVDVLVKKTIRVAQKYKVKSILLSGGVSANQNLRDELKLNARRYPPAGGLNAEFFAPAKNLCTDNAAMIASAAFFNYHPKPWKQITADPELYFD